jgi:hypothetical protein
MGHVPCMGKNRNVFRVWFGNLNLRDHLEDRGVDERIILTHWNTQPAVRRAEPSVPLLLILAFCR